MLLMPAALPLRHADIITYTRLMPLIHGWRAAFIRHAAMMPRRY